MIYLNNKLLEDIVMINISTKAEDSRVIDSIVLGFSADPILRWLYPEP